MRIFLSVGHSILKNGSCTSSSGYVNEYKYNKELSGYIKTALESMGHTCDVIICPERQFTGIYQERQYKLPIANSGRYDLVCELHLNAFNKSAHGTEVYYYKGDSKGKAIADRYCKAMESLGFVNRGSKVKNLYMINETYPTAVLLESFFCDNEKDCNIANKAGFRKIAENVAYALTGSIPPETKEKKKCVMYFREGNKKTAEYIASMLNIPCYLDNGKDLPKDDYDKFNILYVGDFGRNRIETGRIAVTKYLR